MGLLEPTYTTCHTCGGPVANGCVIEFECTDCKVKACQHDWQLVPQGEKPGLPVRYCVKCLTFEDVPPETCQHVWVRTEDREIAQCVRCRSLTDASMVKLVAEVAPPPVPPKSPGRNILVDP